MSIENIGRDAQFILNSESYKSAIKSLEHNIEVEQLNADTDNLAHCQRMVITKQLLSMVTRELANQINDSTFEISLREMNKPKVSEFKR